MFQLIDKVDMKEGERYCVKRFDTIIGDLTFVKYHTFINSSFATFHSSLPGYSSFGYSNLWLDTICVYRIIGEKEYYEKMKEKYDTKCLNVVLKKIIDESFEW
jgi:hypothetical protein